MIFVLKSMDHPKVKNAFLQVKSDDGEEFPLPSALQVRLYKTVGGCDYFTIQEGVRQGIKASVKHDDDSSSFLSSENLLTGPVQLTYSLSKKILTLDTAEFKTDDDPTSKIPKGLYDIEIPDYSHKLTRSYLDRADLALMWFRISHDHSQARYIHVGSFSAGCVTMTEQIRWDDLCRILMCARKGDGKSVGTLEVVE